MNIKNKLLFSFVSQNVKTQSATCLLRSTRIWKLIIFGSNKDSTLFSYSGQYKTEVGHLDKLIIKHLLRNMFVPMNVKELNTD